MKKYILFILLVLFFIEAQAQIPKNKSLKIAVKNNNAFDPTNLLIFDDSKKYSLQNTDQIFKDVFNMSSATTYSLIREDIDEQGFIHQKLQQYYKGVKVEFGIVTLHSLNGIVKSMSSEYYHFDENFNTIPLLNNLYAFNKAILHTGASSYLWEDIEASLELGYEKPTGELIILPITGDENAKLKLAYRFDIYTIEPFGGGDLYVDAINGDALFFNNKVKHYDNFGHNGKVISTVQTEIEYCNQINNNYSITALGTADTRYSGSQQIETRFSGGTYSLNDDSGRKVYTRNANNLAPVGNSLPYVATYTEFEDLDNNWTAGEFDNAAKDNAALDAHWGMMMTYDYWSTTHSRSSYDNSGSQLRSYVHVDTDYNNAFWFLNVMSYGDGNDILFDALTSLDVAAHEMGHGVTEYTANLAYQRESGAMNEGYSDIWGADVEYFAKGTGPDTSPNAEVWLIGEDIMANGAAALRSMSDPKSQGQPDTYGGTYWIDPNCGTPTNGNDYCGVHTNSGVLNYWYYLTSVGGSGTNDNSDAYSVSGIGMTKASAIAYRTLNLYLGSNSTFANARTFSIQAAQDLYGVCSIEEKTITDAWHAVGVGAAYVNICIPSISFAITAASVVEETDCSYVDVDVTLNIAIAATEDAVVTFAINGSSTATNLMDFNLQTQDVTFLAGTTTSQTMTVSVYSDGFVEGDETVIIDFTVDANEGDATADTSADTFTLTLTDDDLAPISFQNTTLFSDGFESYSSFNIGTVGSWTMLDNDGDSTYGSTTYDYTNENYTGTFIVFAPNETTPTATGTVWDAHTGSKGYYCFNSTGNVSGTPLNDDYIFTPQIDLSGTGSELKFWAKSLTDLYGLERFKVGISTTNTNPGSFTYLTPNPYEEAPIIWTEYTYDLSSYDGQSIYITIQVVSADAFAFMLDDFTVTSNITTNVQTSVNTSTTNDSQDLAISGTIYTSDSSTGNVMMDITNNLPDDYGCIDISVSREGTGAQSYNGSVTPNLVMNKTFDISAANEVFGGDVSVVFYFTEDEILGWETITGLSRNALVAGREFEGLLLETSTLSIGSFGSNVTLTGTFSGLSDKFIFGPTGISELSTTCSGLKIWDGSSWLNAGIPDTTDLVFIAENYNTSEANIDACKIFVRASKTLTVESGDYIHSESDIRIDGILFVENEGSVVQVEDTALVINNGAITVTKTTSFDDPLDFSILGSPMSGATREVEYSESTMVKYHDTNLFSPHTDVTALDPGAEHFADDNGDNWITHTDLLTPGEGYLVRPSAAGGTFTITYNTGTLNNGDYNFTAIYNTPGPDPAANKKASPNVLSNPYASAIRIDEFLNANSNAGGTLYFWEHITAVNSNYPGYSSANYNMGDISWRNNTGGMPATNGGGTPSNLLPSGQGFGIKASGAGTITFTNAMRSKGPNTGYRNNVTAIDRLYLKVTNDTYALKSHTLIGFTELATDDYDQNYDSKRLATPISIYSINGDRELGIQGRSAFNDSHFIPLGFTTHVEENQEYTISIDSIEGELLEQATVFLKDNLLNTLTNLSESDYSFASNEGHQVDRFTLVFESEPVLGNEDLERFISIYPNPVSSILIINSTKSPIESVMVYDLQGRIVKQWNGETVSILQLDVSVLKSSIYFVKINTTQGNITKRLLKW